MVIILITVSLLVILYPKLRSNDQLLPKGGRRVLNIPLKDIEGNTFSLDDFRDHIVIIDLMATWCIACVEEVETLKNVEASYGDEIEIVSISLDIVSDTEERLSEFKQELGIDWTVARDTEQQNFFLEYGLEDYGAYLPIIVIADRDGYVRFRDMGGTGEKTLTRIIDDLMGD